MLQNNFELPENYLIYDVNDISSLDEEKIYEIADTDIMKLRFHLTSLNQLNQFEKFPVYNFNKLHTSLVCTKQIFKMLDFENILKNSIIKNIKVEDLLISVNFYISDEISEITLRNNIKIIDVLNNQDNDIELNSKIFELLYHANDILKNFKKQNDRINSIKDKVSNINHYLEKM